MHRNSVQPPTKKVTKGVVLKVNFPKSTPNPLLGAENTRSKTQAQNLTEVVTTPMPVLSPFTDTPPNAPINLAAEVLDVSPLPTPSEKASLPGNKILKDNRKLLLPTSSSAQQKDKVAIGVSEEDMEESIEEDEDAAARLNNQDDLDRSVEPLVMAGAVAGDPQYDVKTLYMMHLTHTSDWPDGFIDFIDDDLLNGANKDKEKKQKNKHTTASQLRQS